MATAQLLDLPATPTRRWGAGVCVLVGLALALAIGLASGGEAGRFATTGLTFAPAIALVGLLHIRRWRAARIASWILFWLAMVGVAAVVLGLIAASMSPAETALSADDAGRLVLPGVLVLAILVVGALLTVTSTWFPLARRLGAHLDKADAAHAQGTIGLLLVSTLAIAPLTVLGGQAPLLAVLARVEVKDLTSGVTEQLLAQVYQILWTGVLVVWACAWPARVGLTSALSRLGIRPLCKRDFLPLGGIVLASVALGIGLDALNRTILGGLGWPLTDGSIVTRLVPIARIPAGALLVAVCAGTSEELVFRGLLQPRFGWLLPNVGFAAIHAFQYGLDGLVVVFALGTVLAFVRRRWNTTAAIGVHTSYDALLLLIGTVQGS
jgi:membrane protease YdiL (CAAX protease family)